MEPIEIDSEGKIQQVKMTTQGSEGPLEAYQRILAARACSLKGNSYIKEGSEKTFLLVNNTSGSYAGYKYIDFGEGEKPLALKFICRIYVESREGTINICLDHPGTPPVAIIELRDVEEKVWLDLDLQLDSIRGERALYLTFHSKAADHSLCQLNWFRFEKQRG